MRLARPARLATFAALAAGLLAPAAAQADRPATPDEQAAITQVTGVPVACQRARISTKDPSWGYASLTNAEGCPVGDGYALLRRRGAGFANLGSASFEDPACPLKGVPYAVGLDLKLCHRPRHYLGCANSDLTFVQGQVKPRTCGLLAFRGTGLFLRKMRWSSWGGSTAYGRGYTGGQRIRVTLYGRVKFSGDWCYTRLRYRVKAGGGPFRFPRCGFEVGE